MLQRLPQAAAAAGKQKRAAADNAKHAGKQRQELQSQHPGPEAQGPDESEGDSVRPGPCEAGTVAAGVSGGVDVTIAAAAATDASPLPDPLVLVDPDLTSASGGAAARQFSALASAAAALGVPLVSYKWLMTCAGSYSTEPWLPYKVGR